MNSLSTILSSSTGTQASGGSSVMFIVVYVAIFCNHLLHDDQTTEEAEGQDRPDAFTDGAW